MHQHATSNLPMNPTAKQLSPPEPHKRLNHGTKRVGRPLHCTGTVENALRAPGRTCLRRNFPLQALSATLKRYVIPNVTIYGVKSEKLSFLVSKLGRIATRELPTGDDRLEGRTGPPRVYTYIQSMALFSHNNNYKNTATICSSSNGSSVTSES